MSKKRRHRHSLECIVVRRGQAHCRVQLARAKRAAESRKLLTKGQKACAAKFIPEEVSSKKWPGGNKQAVAVGLSRARQECR